MQYHDEERVGDRDDFICKRGKQDNSIHAPHQVVKLDGHQYHVPDASCSSHFLSAQKRHVCFSLALYLHTPITSFLQAPLSRQRAGLVSNRRFGKGLPSRLPPSHTLLIPISTSQSLPMALPLANLGEYALSVSRFDLVVDG